jgi:hypothetical protein
MSATGHDRAYGFSLIATPHAANEQAETTKRRFAIRALQVAALERTKTLRPPIGDGKKTRHACLSATPEKSRTSI